METFWDFKLKIELFWFPTISNKMFAASLKQFYPELELLQEGLDCLHFNSSVKRSSLLKTWAIIMRQGSPQWKGILSVVKCQEISHAPCSAWLGSWYSVVSWNTLDSSKRRNVGVNWRFLPWMFLLFLLPDIFSLNDLGSQ